MATKRSGSPLSAGFVRTVTRPGRYGDGYGGHGLSLMVRKANQSGRISKAWAQRLIDPVSGAGDFGGARSVSGGRSG